MVGKHPSEAQAAIYDISTAVPVFFDVSENPDTSDQYTAYLQACNTYFQNMYE